MPGAVEVARVAAARVGVAPEPSSCGAAPRSRRRDERRVHDTGQPSERGQVAAVFLAVVSFRRLENAGMPGEALVVQEQSKRFGPKLAIADIGMSVNQRPETFLRIIEMKNAQTMQSDDVVERLHRAV